MVPAPDMPSNTVRCYRFALRPTPVQARAMARATGQARRQWNELVALLRWAENEQRHGRREALVHEYGRILAGKKLWGMAFKKARKLMVERGLMTEEEAIAISRAEQVETVRKWGRRALALAYAVERAQANAKRKPLIFSAQTVVAIVRKFERANTHYVSGKRRRPRFKAKRGPVTLQRQIDPDNVNAVDFVRGTVDLASLLGSECCRAVPTRLHRPLHAGAKIKQMAVTSTATRSFVILMVEAPAAAFLRPVPEVLSSTVAGIDPGCKTALTVSDTTGEVQFSIEPPLFHDRPFLKSLKRFQRRAARQLRAANPARLDEKGCWKKGRGPVVVTKNWCKTRAKLAEGMRHIADARRDVYHLAANRLLREFAVVGIGNWRGKKKVPKKSKGQRAQKRRDHGRKKDKTPKKGKGQRAQNRRNHGNALGMFTRMLNEKAQWCSRPRHVLTIQEAYTTRSCPDCGELTGPNGTKDLGVRVWTCTSCGQTHQRDFASARAIARRTLAKTAAGAQPAQPEPSPKKARTPAAPSTQVHARTERARSPLARKTASERERRTGVSAAPIPTGRGSVGVEVAKEPAPCSQPPIWQQPDLPLAYQDHRVIHA